MTKIGSLHKDNFDQFHDLGAAGADGGKPIQALGNNGKWLTGTLWKDGDFKPDPTMNEWPKSGEPKGLDRKASTNFLETFFPKNA
jgi:hypothetical protein